MKRIFLAIAITCLAVFTSQESIAQDFEGKITMNIEYEEVPEEFEQYISMFPKENIIYVKGQKSRVESLSMMGSNIIIIDHENGTGVTLSDMMGQKIAMKMDSTDLQKNDTTAAPSISYKEGTKDIAGYKCKKAEIKFKDEEEVMSIWYTEELSSKANSSFSGLKGMPMEYTVLKNGMEMVMTVTKVSKEKVSDDKFVIPDGYTLKSQSEMMNMMNGGGGTDDK